FVFCIEGVGYSQTSKVYMLSGQITDAESGHALPGALIRIKELDRFEVADELGKYSLKLPSGTYQVSVDFLGFDIHQSSITLVQDQVLDFSLSPLEIAMDGVEVMATGYQEIPKERATGSFVQLDRELVNRRVSTNLIDRLEDVTSGLVFNRTGPA
ncbi:carboxypeptidase-like regulatory domain-containing protein, partial [Campylobacter fetus subsp. venerealis]